MVPPRCGRWHQLPVPNLAPSERAARPGAALPFCNLKVTGPAGAQDRWASGAQAAGLTLSQAPPHLGCWSSKSDSWCRHPSACAHYTQRKPVGVRS